MRLGLKVIIPIVVGCVFLSGCSSDKFTEGAKKTESKNQEIKKEKKQKEATQEKDQKEFYKNLAKPLDEVVQENDLDHVNLMVSAEYAQKEQYKDGSEFAKFAGHMLYQFYTLQISPDQFYEFLKKYGSKNTLKKTPTKKDSITILTSLQDMFKKQNITGENYLLTEVIYNQLKREGRFYRKVLTTNGEEYYITTIVKENGEWKYDEDSPSPPFTVSSDTLQTENSTSN
jgi:hypothetical protein